MMQRSIWRVLLGALVTAMGGLGMTNSIFPLLLVRLMEEIPLDILINIRDTGPQMALLWAMGGAMVGWLGGTRSGALIMGLCGGLTGYWLGAVAAKGDPQLIVWGTVIGLLYGIPGGLVMGRVFPRTVSET
jgi:hypothetical protein